MKVRGSDEQSGTPTGPDGLAVRQMFADIAPRYDLLNHLLSASIDRRWRRAAVARVKENLADNPEAVCLDLCSGTGDLSLELHRLLKLPVVASDFCHPMLKISNRKAASAGYLPNIRTVEADAMVLPFADSMFDAVTNAFGLRNLEDPGKGLRETHRVLKPGGIVVILEFAKPVVPVFRTVFDFYFTNVLPRLGSVISGQGFAYTYLPDSVRKFPDQRNLAGMLESAGFMQVGYRNLTGGIAALHWGIR